MNHIEHQHINNFGDTHINRTRTLQEKEYNNVDWIHMAQDREEWQAPVTAVINLQVPYKRVISLCFSDSFSRALHN
jgi:hypothetical protein